MKTYMQVGMTMPPAIRALLEANRVDLARDEALKGALELLKLVADWDDQDEDDAYCLICRVVTIGSHAQLCPIPQAIWRIAQRLEGDPGHLAFRDFFGHDYEANPGLNPDRRIGIDSTKEKPPWALSDGYVLRAHGAEYPRKDR